MRDCEKSNTLDRSSLSPQTGMFRADTAADLHPTNAVPLLQLIHYSAEPLWEFIGISAFDVQCGV